MFFDPEKFTMNGEEPTQRMLDMKNLYSRDTVPKAKELSSNEEKDIVNSDDRNKEILKSDKKQKISFRNRKVCVTLFIL